MINPVELLILAIPLAIVVGIAARSFRTVDDRAITDWTKTYGLSDDPTQRPLVSSYLRRTRRWRAGGASLARSAPSRSRRSPTGARPFPTWRSSPAATCWER